MLGNKGDGVGKQDLLRGAAAWFLPLLTMSCLAMAGANAPRSLESYSYQQGVALSEHLDSSHKL